MQDLLVLWDAIFADGIGFDLVDYMFVAMLLYIRDHCEYDVNLKIPEFYHIHMTSCLRV